MGGGRHHRGQGQGDGKGGGKKKDDRNYKSPLSALPDKPFDPWANMRSADPKTPDKSNN
jgi:hypothetical protein